MKQTNRLWQKQDSIEELKVAAFRILVLPTAKPFPDRMAPVSYGFLGCPWWPESMAKVLKNIKVY